MNGFSGFGNSPVKQVKGYESKAKNKIVTDWNYENKKAQNQKLAKVTKKQTFTKKGVIDMGTGKEVTKFPKDKSIQKITKGGKQILKKVGKVARFAGKATGVGLVGEGLYQAYKSGQKHSKGKAVKGQKTGVVTPKKSIYDKPKKSIYKK